jgi:hypothetical protein
MPGTVPRTRCKSVPHIALAVIKAVVFHGIGDIRLDDVREPKRQNDYDAIVRIMNRLLRKERRAGLKCSHGYPQRGIR